MRKLEINNALLLVIFLFFSTGYSACHAQLIDVEHIIDAYCGTVRDQIGSSSKVNVSFFVDDKPQPDIFYKYGVGKHIVLVAITTTQGYEAASESYVIKKIEWKGITSTGARKIIQTFIPNNKVFRFEVDINPTDPYIGYAIVAQVDKCGDLSNEINTNTPTHAVNEVRVVGLRPSVSVHKAGTPEYDWQELTLDRVLQEGDEISCDPDGIVILQFADQSTTTVKNTTQLKIASYFTEGGVVKTEILLKMGEVAAQIHKSEATKSDFRIKTPTDVSGVRGTIYSVNYIPARKTNIVKVEEGIVEIQPVNPSIVPVTLYAGQQIEVGMENMSKVKPLTEKIDLSIPEKTSTDASSPTGSSSAIWKVTEGAISGILTLYQSDNKLSGTLSWNNNQNGKLESGYLFANSLLFTVLYPGDVKVVYTAILDQSGLKMLKGNSISNIGTSVSWSGIKQY